MKEKVAIVAGAGGIGQAVARRLAEEGCRVVVADVDLGKTTEIAQVLNNLGYKVVGIRVDVTDPESVKQMVKSAVDEFGTVHILVNCFASPIFGNFLELSDKAWKTVIEVKYLGCVRTIREVLPYMINQEDGRIVNISGIAGKEPTPFHLPGGSVNAAINQITKGLARWVGKHNIRVNAVSPGRTATERLVRATEVTAKETQTSVEETARSEVTDIPLGRVAEPEEIAEAIVFLVSDKSRYISGTCLTVDGGRTRSV